MAAPDDYISSISLWPMNWAPVGWALCQGQLISIAEYTSAYSILGTIYGGNGMTNFALPDYAGRIPFGADSGGDDEIIGNSAGQNTIFLTSENVGLPLHTHQVNMDVTIKAFVGGGTSVSPVSNYLANSPGGDGYNDSPNAAMEPQITVFRTNKNTPSPSQKPISLLPPYLCINYIICLEGAWPPRN